MNKIWVFGLIFCVIVSLVGVALFNSVIDAANQFHEGEIQRAAQLVASGKNILGLSNSDERTYQRELILRYSNKVRTIVVGSSRMMRVRSEHVPYPKPYLNHAMSGSTLEDCMAIVGIYKKERGYIPDYVILGIDPWYFNANSGMLGWKGLKEYVDLVSGVENRQDVFAGKAIFKKYSNLLSFQYTKENIKKICSESGNGVMPLENLEVEHMVRRKDNSIDPPLSKRVPIREDEILFEVNAMMAHSVYAMENFNELYHVDMFKSFLDYLDAEGSTVVLYLPPFVRLAYHRMSADSRYAIIADSEALVRRIAAQRGLDVVGSFDPERCGIVDSDFADLTHGRAVMSAKLFARRQ